MAAPLGPDTLPEHCSYGVCRDGRVFFVHNDTRTTTWLHPRTGEPVNSGHMIRSDLPRGWEEGFTNEGASYFINHNQRATTFRHPVTGQVSAENVDFFLQQQPAVLQMSKLHGDTRPSSTVSEASTADAPSGPKVSRATSRVHSFGKRDQAIKRNPNATVVVRGWLYKQDSSGMRLWKRKWFVLADYCLFYYKDSREELVLGSIPLPSYAVSAVQPEDHISRKYAFKASHTGMRSYIYKQSSMIGSQAEHVGMRTYFFSADTQEDMSGWLKAMNQAALMQNHGDTLDRWSSETKAELSELAEQQAVPQTNHVHQPAEPQPENVFPQPENVFLQPESVFLQPENMFPQPESVFLQPESVFLQDADECCSFHQDAPLAPAPENPGGLAAETASLRSNPAPLADPESAPGSRAPSRGPLRAASTLPPGASMRNGSVRTPPTPIQEPNGIGAGTYVRASTLPPMDGHRQVQRKSALEQVEQWVKVQRAEHKGPPSREGTLPRRTPPAQPKFATLEAYQSLPKTPRPSPPMAARQGEYKYAQDRLSHFRLVPEGPHQAGPVWQLYEWQQRHQYRHGSPTAPLYTPAPDYPFGPRPASTVPPSAPRSGSLGGPRCVSVPPSPSDIPPPGPPPGCSGTMSPSKRPHTPAGRLTVQPQGALVDGPFSGSPRRAKSQLLKAATIERRSMPPSGYITHTVSAPSLHGKTPEELTLLLIQLRRHQAKMASARHHTLAQLQQLNYPSVPLHHHLLNTTYTTATAASPLLSGPAHLPHTGPSGTQPDKQYSNVDDTYLQLKKDLEYLDLKVVGSQTLKEAGKPVKVAESDVDVKLSRLCEQDKVLRELEVRLSSLKEDKDKLEVVLDMSHQQMEKYQDQPAHTQKIAYQQKLLQEDLVNIRAQVSRVSTEMTRAWEEYSSLESSVEQLRTLLQAHINHSATPQQEKTEIKRELWRIEDVMGGLSSSRSNYQITIDSVQNPERKLVPSVSDATMPSQSAEVQPPPRSSNASPAPSPTPHTLPLSTVPKWAEDQAPPRPPLPHLYDQEEVPPVVPPLPRDASVIRHTSVRGLKRQSDERKRDREGGHYVNGDSKVELRSYLSEPELPGMSGGAGDPEADYQMLSNKGLPGSSFRLNHSNHISSYVTLRRGAGSLVTKERPRSALERLYSPSDDQPAPGASQQRGRMSAEEQLERMKRHQRALVRERKRTLSQGERHSAVSARRSSSSGARLPAAASGPEPPPPAAQQGEARRAAQVEEERLGAEGQSDEGQRVQSDEWLTVMAKPMREWDLEPIDYDLDLSRELSMPQKVPIPERYVESDPDDPITPEEREERSRRADRIKNILAKSNVQKMQRSSGVCDPVDFSDLESVLQQQERIMSVSQALASEASRKSKLVAESQGEERW
ncbi:pleckstrin homology domain-containing family A member 7 [Aplochiton taeniatus]